MTQATRDLLAESLAIDLPAIAKSAELPHLHGAPFDRIVIAQALLRSCAVITSDPRFAPYGVKVIW